MVGCGEVNRNGHVSGNGGMGGSNWVIRGASRSDQASRWMSGHRETWEGVNRHRGADRSRGVESSL